MASGRHKEAQVSGEQFARPLWDACRDLEIEYQCDVRCEVVMSGRKGVLEVRLSAYPGGTGVKGGCLCAAADDWPGATVQSLPAQLYRLAFKLGHLLEEHRMQKAAADEEFRKWRA